VLQHILPKDLPKTVAEIKRVATSQALIISAEAVGSFETDGYWEHPIEVYKKLFSPWQITWRQERVANPGLVMRFERISKQKQ
jgi:hypothetical protein